MSSAIIYYGAPPSGQQHISESLRIKGINLLKASVRKVRPDGIRYIVSPSYDIYVENIHIAMASAELNEPLALSAANRYIRFTNKTDIPGFDKMKVVWNYEGILPAMDQTGFDAMKARFDPSDLSIYGKPAFFAELTIAQLIALKKTQVNEICPTVSGSINVASAIALIKVQRLARAFLTAHQYALSSDGSDTRAEMKKMFNIVSWNATHKVNINSLDLTLTNISRLRLISMVLE
jgi:hypothetical protein